MFFANEIVVGAISSLQFRRTHSRGPCDEISGYLFRGAMSAWVRTGKEFWSVARQAEGEGPRERVDAAQPRPPPSSETEPGRHPTEQRPNQRTSEPTNQRTSERANQWRGWTLAPAPAAVLVVVCRLQPSIAVRPSRPSRRVGRLVRSPAPFPDDFSRSSILALPGFSPSRA